MSTIYAVVNQKGGVGKTTTCVNLAAFLANFGKKVLVVDLDSQGNASSGLGVERMRVERCLYDVIIGEMSAQDAIIPSSINGLDIIPATPKLAGADVELVDKNQREYKLKEALECIRDKYEYILIDCPPSLSLLTVNALTAAHEVIIPIQCEYYALEGISQLTKTLDMVKNSLNPNLKICGIVMTMYNKRTVLAEQVVEETKKHFGTKVFKTIIPRNVRLAEAPSFGQPILFYDPGSTGAKAYEQLTQEMISEEVFECQTLNEV